MKVRIGCQVDHDARQYSFPRSSGLPAGYFDRPTLPDGWLAVFLVLCFVVALVVA